MELTISDYDRIHQEDNPPYKRGPSKILFQIIDNGHHGLAIEELFHTGGDAEIEHDNGALDYGLLEIIDKEFEKEGWYVCEGFTVRYTRGDGWTTDDDADYECERFRRATWGDMLDFKARPRPLSICFIMLFGFDPLVLTPAEEHASRILPDRYWPTF